MSAAKSCPAWCDEHETTEYADATVEHHRKSLFASWAPSGAWVFHLYVDSCDIDGGAFAPGTEPAMALVENSGDESNNVPRSLSPAQARELAAALLRGAEIVEASQTAACPDCGATVHPRALLSDEGGICVACWRAGRESRRARMTLV